MNNNAVTLRSLTVSEMLEERFLQCHMDALRLYISLLRLHEQRERIRLAHPDRETPDETDDRDEFEMELTNLHAVLTNRHLQATKVIQKVHTSIRQYLALWPGAAEAVDRWWFPRSDKHAAVHADLQLLVPGIWLGSSATLQHEHTELLLKKQIRHIVYCTTTAVDHDADFFHGAERAHCHDSAQTARGFPLIVSHPQSDNDATTVHYHSITLFQLGRMEFIVRRRDKKLPTCLGSDAIHKVCVFLQQLLTRLTNEQHQYEREVFVESEIPYVDHFGILLYCDSGTSASIVVAIALLMAQLCVSYDIAYRLVTCARRYVAPSEFFEHVLRAFDSSRQNTAKREIAISRKIGIS